MHPLSRIIYIKGLPRVGGTFFWMRNGTHTQTNNPPKGAVAVKSICSRCKIGDSPNRRNLHWESEGLFYWRCRILPTLSETALVMPQANETGSVCRRSPHAMNKKPCCNGKRSIGASQSRVTKRSSRNSSEKRRQSRDKGWRGRSRWKR